MIIIVIIIIIMIMVTGVFLSSYCSKHSPKIDQ